MTRNVDVFIRADASTSGASAKLSALGRVGKGAGAAVAAGTLVAGAAAIKLGLDSIKAASDVQQSFGALDSIYGKSSERVKRWAEDAANSVGLAKAEYAQLSAVVGAQLTGMGFAQDQAAGKTDNLIRLGSDLAATFGGSVTDAVSAVSSLLKGEADPIEAYGVSIKKADINARLAAEGLVGLEGAALKQAEAQAALTLLTEQTANAQGAFARETDTLAGQQERLGAQVDNLKAKLGEKLLPVITRLATYANEKVIPGIEKWAGILAERLGPTLSRVAAFITDRVVPAAQDLYRWFVDKIVPGLRDTLQPVLEGARKAFDKIKDTIDENSEELNTLRRWFGRIVEFIVNDLGPIYGKYLKNQLETAGTAVSTLIDFISTLVGWLQDAYNAAQNVIDALGRLKDKAGGGIPGLGLLGAVLPRMTGGRATSSRTTYSPTYAPRITVQGGGLYDETSMVTRVRSALVADMRRLNRPGATLFRPELGYV